MGRRLLRSWYEGAFCKVKCDGELSESFMVERGVKQGSVLSPSLFLPVNDPLLKQLETSGLGLSVKNFYAGGFLHADDIRTLATSADSLSTQISLVKKSFAEENGLYPFRLIPFRLIPFRLTKVTHVPFRPK